MSTPLFQLPHYFAIRVSGADNRTYLQGQLTCDLQLLTEQQALLGALCDAKGKLQATMILVAHQDDIWLILPEATLSTALTQLKKFAVFAKVEFAEASLPVAACLSTEAAANAPKAPFNTTLDGKQCYITLDSNRQLVLFADASPATSAQWAQWQQFSVINGWPELHESLIGRYIPQQLNLEQLGAISYDKGCYLGQETVTRVHYRGGIKRGLFRLQGTSQQAPEVGADIQIQRGSSWRRGGQIVSVATAGDEQWQLLAVLPLDTEADALFRTYEQASAEESFQLAPLPYAPLSEN